MLLTQYPFSCPDPPLNRTTVPGIAHHTCPLDLGSDPQGREQVRLCQRKMTTGPLEKQIVGCCPLCSELKLSRDSSEDHSRQTISRPDAGVIEKRAGEAKKDLFSSPVKLTTSFYIK